MIHQPIRASNMLRNLPKVFVNEICRKLQGASHRDYLQAQKLQAYLCMIDPSKRLEGGLREGGPKGGNIKPQKGGGGPPAHPLNYDVSTHNGSKHAEEPTESFCKRQLPKALKSQLS